MSKILKKILAVFLLILILFSVSYNVIGTSSEGETELRRRYQGKSNL